MVLYLALLKANVCVCVFVVFFSCAYTFLGFGYRNAVFFIVQIYNSWSYSPWGCKESDITE